MRGVVLCGHGATERQYAAMSQRQKLLDEAVAEARQIAKKSNLSDAERKDLTRRVEAIEIMKGEIAKEKVLDEALGGPPAGERNGEGGTLYQTARAKGWDPENFDKGGIHKVSLGATYGQKAIMADGTDASILQIGFTGRGQDDRFAYPAFPSVGLGSATSVQGLQQTARTLATPADMDVAIAGSDTKPTSVITAALSTVDAKMIAHVTELIPNAVFKLPHFGAWIQREMSFGLGRGIDQYLCDQLAAASGTTTHLQGTDTVYDAYRKAVGAARAAGYRPDIALLHPNDAIVLDLSKDANDRFYSNSAPHAAPSADPLWGLRRIESNAVVEKAPILVDTQLFGNVYFGATEFATNPFEAFTTNQSRARLEVPMCVFIENAAAIVEITLN